ncbi:nitroreductase [Neptunitalea chrysea]|uniref:Nitroreductase n=1 Tax=Neptunitalea chrysea TaxID=1647581 RepID=A0A9W6B8U7_9FLAO|nr:nitroreductase family protein [Neptunitalea chrysea]GLB53654.1 nitroreductase [Neptunitalea chrysea]
MGIIKHLQWRYATQKFDTSKKIGEDKMAVIKEAFNLTATSYGLQPVTLLVIRDEQVKKELQVHAYNQSQVGECSDLLVFCVPSGYNEQFIHDYFKLVADIRNIPGKELDSYKRFLVKVFGEMSTDEVLLWAVKQAYLVMGNVLTVCAIEGIDACPMEGFKPDAFDEALQLADKNLKSVLIMPIGYRAEDDTYAAMKKVRKHINDSVIDI